MIVKTTKEILVESFFELAEKKNINKITIREIAENCGMASATFYRHFQNKYDLIVWDYMQRMSRIMKQACSEDWPWNDMQIAYIRFHEENRNLFLNILKNTGAYDAFNRDMMNVCASQIRYYLREKKGMDEPSARMALYIHIYCNSAALIICEWLLGIISEEIADLAQILNDSIPAPLRDKLTE